MSTQSYLPSRNVAARPSPGKGRGVFTTRRIRAGEIIETAPVLLVPKDEMEALAESFLGHYMFKSDNKKHFVIGLGFTSLINHAVDANSEFLISIDNIVIKAKRAIAAGAEVTIDYGWRAEDWALAGVAKMPD